MNDCLQHRELRMKSASQKMGKRGSTETQEPVAELVDLPDYDTHVRMLTAAREDPADISPI